MADMPTDEEFMLIETLKLATLRERRYMALLARYNELLKNSPGRNDFEKKIYGC